MVLMDSIRARQLMLVGLLVGWWCWSAQGENGAAGDQGRSGASAGSPADPPQPYMRVQRGEEGTVSLQIALRQFLPRDTEGPEIWLAGVSHVGETNYYQELEAFLKRRTLVLFEGVGFDKQVFRERQRQLRADPNAEGSLQTVLASSLDLAFQLDTIDYDQDHFRNSDMTVEEIQKLMLRQAEEGRLDGVAESNPEFLALMAAMEGSSWLGAFLHVGVKLLGTNPKLKAMTRLMLIEVLGGVRGDLSEMQGLPPDVQELLRVLIRARNGVVLRDLKDALAESDRDSSVAVFYGAAHMDDLEKRLRNELSYRSGEERWMTALKVHPEAAGLSATEINAIRGLIDLQWQALKSVPTQPSSAPIR